MRLFTSLALGAVLAFSVYADEIEIPFESTVLDNGLTVVVHEDHKAPIVAVNIWYHVGSKDEIPGRTGFAHLFEHLMFEGSENYDDEYRIPFNRVGVTGQNATTWFDRTIYFQTVPSTALDLALWMESDRMGYFASAITQEKLDEQRGVVQNEKRQGQNQPYDAVWEPLLKQVFVGNHPYSWETIGSMEDLEAATLDDVRDWFSRYYGPDNAVLVIAGDVDADHAIARARHYFGEIPPGPPIRRFDKWIPRHTVERRQKMRDRVPQARVYKAWTAPQWGTRESHHLQLAMNILGRGKNSRLFERLVYQDQIATDAGTSYYALEIAGFVTAIATAQPGTPLESVERALDEELASFIANGPTEAELERVKAQSRAAFIRGVEKVGGFGGKSDVLARNTVYGGRADYYKTRLTDIETATTKDLQNVVADWLSQGPFVMEVEPDRGYSSAGSGADRTRLPEPDTFPEGQFPAHERGELSNGIEVLLVRRDSLPLVRLSLIFDAGFAADQHHKPGTAALTMAMLDEGTKNRTSLEISEALAMLGATLGAGSNLDNSVVNLSALTENLDESLDVFADVVLNPNFPERDLERVRKSYIASIRQEKSDPQSLAARVLPGLLYGPQHAYGQPLTGSGTEESVAAIGRDDLVDFHRTWLRPDNATFVVVGDTTMKEIVPRLEARLKSWGRGESPAKNIAEVARPRGNVLYLMDKPGAVQSVIFAGTLVPPRSDGDDLSLGLMNDVFGATPSSRLNLNLREDKRWSYGAFSFLLDARGQRPFLAYASVQTDSTAAALAEMRREVAEIATTRPPEASEVDIMKRKKTLALPGRWETSGAVLGALSALVRFGLAEDYWQQYGQRIESVSVEAVAKAAADHISSEHTIWVVVGDRSVIDESLGAIEFDQILTIDADGNPM